ncbi:unnamed protein product [Rhizophagus irregularis]|nr:unnamed protein product [Rhizophagus irregularis]
MSGNTGTSSHQSKKVVTKDDWVKKLEDVKIDKNDLNKLIMNYFVIEGYKDAAETFSQECGLLPSIDVDSIQDQYIREGKIAEALEFAQDELAPRGEENPEFLEELERTMALLAFDDTNSFSRW